jgi:beta-glucosidase
LLLLLPLTFKMSASGEHPHHLLREKAQEAEGQLPSSSFDDDKDNAHIQKLLASMSVDDKIGQMAQVDIALLLEDGDISFLIEGGRTGKRLNASLVEYFIGDIGVGSIQNTPAVPWTALDYRRAMIQIQQVAARHNRPPVIWGLDSVHGANYVHNATLTPQAINIAATWNVTVAHQAGRLASRDTRAAGLQWVFSPLLGLAFQPMWSRLYETFGEDPALVGDMASHMIQAFKRWMLTCRSEPPPPVPASDGSPQRS